MIDAQKLLEQFIGGNGGQRPPSNRSAAGSGGSPLDSIPESFKGFGGGLAAGGLAGLLIGSKGGRKMAKKAVKIGGMAVLGGLAYKAYRDWQAGRVSQSTPTSEARESPTQMKDVTPKAEGTAFLPAAHSERNDLGVKLVQAMIAAAKADGHIDAQEQSRIFSKLDESSFNTEEKAFLMDELRKPLDIDAIVRLANSDEQAVEIYAASYLAIDPDDPAEKAYLAMLGARMKLDPDLVTNIHKEIGEAVGG
jgi:uncharacterized membrane protein YebE (DUF533 family)